MRAQLDEEFRDFMHGRWPAMVRLAYALTGDQGHAEDVAQTAFARTYASWPKVRRTGNPEAYVRRIVINENLNRFRKHRVAERLTDTPPDSAAGALSSSLSGSLSGSLAGSDATRQYDDRSPRLWAAPSGRSRARPHARWPRCGRARNWWMGSFSEHRRRARPARAPRPRLRDHHSAAGPG
jgi:Sigma-70 region 2